jgi:hypothetical protein
MLFDITLGYNPAEFRPGSLLRENTLGGQLNFDNGPFMNLQVPGEIRLSGFHVTRPASGSMPLTAFNGDVIRHECGSRIMLTVPYVPEFNEEFSKTFSSVVVQPIEVIRIPVIDSSTGVVFHKDTIGFLNTVVDTIPFLLSNESDNQCIVTFELSENQSGIIIQEVVTEPDDAETLEVIPERIAIKLHSQAKMVTGNVLVKRVTDDPVTMSITGRMTFDSCSCISAGRVSKSVLHYVPQPTTSLRMVAAEELDTYFMVNEYLYSQSVQEHPVSIQIFDVMGKAYWSTTGQLPIMLSNPDMVQGLYFAAITSHRSRRVISFAKK